MNAEIKIEIESKMFFKKFENGSILLFFVLVHFSSSNKCDENKSLSSAGDSESFYKIALIIPVSFLLNFHY